MSARNSLESEEWHGLSKNSDIEQFRVQGVPPAAYYIPNFITESEEAYLLKKAEESPQPKWRTVGTGRRLQYWEATGGTMSKTGVLLPEPLPDFMTTFPDIVGRLEKFLSEASRGKYQLDINQVLVNEYKSGQGISPHEDGPAFQPLVATISLGSHTVLDIHHYISSSSPSPPMIATASSSTKDRAGEGRSVAAVPLSHLLLLPRSLLILTSSLYLSHLHGISVRDEDVVHCASYCDHEADLDLGVMIANATLLGDTDIIQQMKMSGTWKRKRGVRTSLTFRHAQKVMKGGAFGKTVRALRRAC
ncbi:uncharacterized protein L203_102800 [Cryptococcus depauperatus CBS 7841]|uniref:Fe2OG dioxygenase domain-containing protein n=1 Tax=Cryptococcus depauperatus CBS 7841 TaxID=1295531 RepID=A0AAJ8M1H8_9TREE